ncbi:MAG: hypothetical protein M3463_13120, partial [Verrucomicrobiota bacterium]|nr:hypothetical protein [Verrucomicrobiota bacterium]
LIARRAHADDMIRLLVAVAVWLMSQAGSHAQPQRLISFERRTAVWVANLDGTGAKKVANGSAPSLSPDGSRLAFTADSSDAKSLKRFIAVADLGTGKVTVFKSGIPSENSFNPVWSPHGGQLLFNIHADNDWHLGLVNADGTGFRYFKKAAPKNTSYWSACWAPAGQSVYVQDLDNVYQLAFDATERNKWSLRTLFPDGGCSSGSRFAVSPDGKTLLMDVEMTDEVVRRKDWDGPPPALWTLDLATGKTARLTPKGFLAWSGCWLSNEEILLTTQAAGEKDASVHRLPLGRQARKLLIKDARSPSVSR